MAQDYCKIFQAPSCWRRLCRPRRRRQPQHFLCAALRNCRFRGKSSRAAHVAAMMPPPAAIGSPCIFPDFCGRRQGALPPIARCGWPNRTPSASLPLLYLMPPRAEPGSQHELHATAPDDAQARIDVFSKIFLRWSPPRTRWRLPPPPLCMAPRFLDRTFAQGYGRQIVGPAKRKWRLPRAFRQHRGSPVISLKAEEARQPQWMRACGASGVRN
jgi:hypothetical protein